MTFIAWAATVFHCMLVPECRKGSFIRLHTYPGRRPERKYELEGVGCRNECVVGMRERAIEKYRIILTSFKGYL